MTDGASQRLLPSSNSDVVKSPGARPPSQNAVSSSFRALILVLLMVQNASHGLISKYSTSVLNESYSSSELVLVSELIKLAVCTYLSTNDKTESGR
jgi:hypothetical protein